MNRILGRLIGSVLMATAVLAAGASAAAPGQPVFGLDAPGHSGKSYSIHVTPDERFVVSASTDKSVRIWDAQTGALLRRWALPVADASDGLVAATALSPDGQVLAVGGQLRGFGERYAVALVSLRDGQVLRVIYGLMSGVSALAWSADGRYFAVGFVGGEDNASTEAADNSDLIAAALSNTLVIETGVRVYDTSRWGEPVLDSGFEGRVSDVAFGPGNRLAMVGDLRQAGGEARIFRADGRQFVSESLVNFKKVPGKKLAWSADGGFLYVGGSLCIDAKEGRESGWAGEGSAWSQSASDMGVTRFRESAAGERLIGSAFLPHQNTGVIWLYEGRKRGATARLWKTPDARITDFSVLRDGRLIYVAENGALAGLSPEGDPLWRTASSGALFEGHPEHLQLSDDGTSIRLRSEGAGDAVDIAFNLFEPGYFPPGQVRNWIVPPTSNGTISLLSWQGSSTGSADGRYFPKRSKDERALSAVTPPSGREFVYGSDQGRVFKGFAMAVFAPNSPHWRSWTQANAQIMWSRDFGAPVTAVHVHELRGIVIAATSDGFVRVLRWSDGKTLMTYLLRPEQRKWIATSDRGYFEAGIGSEDLAGWIVNRGVERVADFYPLSRFRAEYLLPGLAQEALKVGDQDDAVKRLLGVRQLAQAGGRKASEAEAEAARKRAEAQAEAVKKAEDARQLAEQQAEAARREREARIQAERQAEATRIAAEQKRQEELRQAELAGQDALRRLEAQAQAQAQARLAEAARQAEQAKKDAAARQIEEARLAEAARQAEVARLAEIRRLEALQKVEAERQQQLALAKAELIRLNAIVASALPADQIVQLTTPALDKLPPVVDILSPGFDVLQSESRLKVRYRIKTPEGAPVTRVQGRVIARSQATRGLMPKVTGSEVHEMELDLPAEDSEIQIVAENQWGASVPVAIKVRWQGIAPKARSLKGDLHIIAVGVSDYDQPDYKLGLAAKDARDFVASLRKQEGGLYRQIQLKILTDRQADKKSVEAAILALRNIVQPQDTTMVFLAGHGINDVGGEYVYLPRDANLASLAETGVSFRLIRDTLARLPGRAVMFVDTCHSGNVIGKLKPGQGKDYTAAINEMASSENNIIVFASSTGAQLSLEDPSWGNGAFTKALVEGLNGEADMKKRGRVTYKQLDAYVSDRVDELTQGRQTPVTPVLQGVPDFTLAEVKR